MNLLSETDNVIDSESVINIFARLRLFRIKLN